MPKQRVPDMEFNHFVLGQIKDLFDKNKIFINQEYQRGDIWKYSQQVELIRSIENRYSMGVLVLFINDNKQYEILDGQQRLLTIRKYLNGGIKLQDTNLTLYNDLDPRDKMEIDAYAVYYLKLKSHDAESKEEDIVQTFLRLQDGAPLNKAEKISAYRGAFKDVFKEARESHALFSLMKDDKRFRLRLLAAEMLLLELESDFKNKIFPGLDLQNFISMLDKYKTSISSTKRTSYKGNLDILHTSLNYLLTALKPRELLSFYLLVSYMRKHKAGNEDIVNELAAFSKEFLRNLNAFGIYDKKPPKGMSVEIFNDYRAYKFEAKVMTTPESVKNRFDIVLKEFRRLKIFIEKDPKRYHDEEQKRILYFSQQGLCLFCKKPMTFSESTADHKIAHSKGGKTDDLKHAQLLHDNCHQKVEKNRGTSPSGTS